MDKNKILEISNDVENAVNKDLITAKNALNDEYEKTKELIIDLTYHLESVEKMYEKIIKEIGKRGV